MKVPLADLRAQYYELKKQIDDGIATVIESGRFSGGAGVESLEKEIAELCGAKHAIGVASGTDALTLSLVACGITPGDEIITTPFTFGATSEAIVQAGARPVYVDIDPCTFNLDIRQIEAQITPKTKALLPVDLYGQMCAREPLVALARKHNLRLIVDSAQSIGARQNGTPIAVGPDAATLSFYCTKNLGAYGDGGMVLTNDSEIAEVLRSLSNHGTYGHKYHYVRIGYCSRLDAIQAVVLHVKLPHLRRWNEARRQNAALYDSLLTDVAAQFGENILLPQTEAGNEHIYHQYTIRHSHRGELQTYLKEREIGTEIYYPMPLHLQPAYTYLGYKEGDFPISEKVANEVLSLPIHPELTEEQVRYVAASIRQFHAERVSLLALV